MANGKGNIGGHPQTPGRVGPAALCEKGRGIWGAPPNPRPGEPCTPCVAGMGRARGHSPNPRQRGPCTLLLCGKRDWTQITLAPDRGGLLSAPIIAGANSCLVLTIFGFRDRINYRRL